MAWFSTTQKKRLAVGISFDAGGTAVAQVSLSSQGRPSLAFCAVQRGAAAADDCPGHELVVRGGLKRAPACGVMANGDYRLLLVESPAVAQDELRSAVRWRIKDLVDFPVEDAAVDVFDIPEQARRGQAAMMYAVAAPRRAVDGQIGRIEATGLDAKVLDIPELCLRNVATMLPQDEAGVALLWFADKHGVLTLSRGGVLYLVRRIEIGLADLRATRDEALATDAFSAAALEVQRSLDYFESHYDQRPVTEVVLAPSDQAIAVAAHLRAELGLSADVLDLNALFDGGGELAADLQADCMLAVGAALREAALQKRTAS